MKKPKKEGSKRQEANYESGGLKSQKEVKISTKDLPPVPNTTEQSQRARTEERPRDVQITGDILKSKRAE